VMAAIRVSCHASCPSDLRHWLSQASIFSSGTLKEGRKVNEGRI
jgi:hypothetical protein